jgi:hypothetical protein
MLTSRPAKNGAAEEQGGFGVALKRLRFDTDARRSIEAGETS